MIEGVAFSWPSSGIASFVHAEFYGGKSAFRAAPDKRPYGDRAAEHEAALQAERRIVGVGAAGRFLGALIYGVLDERPGIPEFAGRHYSVFDRAAVTMEDVPKI